MTRQSEMATRVALGAGRWRLIRQLLTENVLLALIGGVLGIAVAYLGVWVFVTLAPGFYPPSEDITIRPAVLLFTFGVSVSTGILAGLFPALRISRPDLQDALKQSARGGASGIRLGLRRALIVTEVAMALVLLVGAGLMINSYARVMRVDMGFGPDQLLTMEINLSGLSRYRTRRNAAHFSVTPQVAEFYREVMERVKSVPGVRSVGVTSGLPPRQSMTVPFSVVGQAGDPSDEFRNAQYYEVSAEFFETLGIGLMQGRTFTDADGENAAGVAVINETLARQYFGETKRWARSSRLASIAGTQIWPTTVRARSWESLPIRGCACATTRSRWSTFPISSTYRITLEPVPSTSMLAWTSPYGRSSPIRRP